MAESVSRQDEASPVFWLATRTGSMSLPCPLGISNLGPARKKFSFWPNNKSSIYQFKLVWSRCLDTGPIILPFHLPRLRLGLWKRKKKRTWPLSSHLHWTSWSITHICFERTTCARHTYRRHSSCSRWDRYFHVVAGATPESSSLLQSLCSTIFFGSLKTMVIGPAKATELAGPVCWLFQ